MEKAELPARIIIDCSHGNSSKKFENQPIVAGCLTSLPLCLTRFPADVAAQVAGGAWHIMGLMIESNLNAGNQSLKPGETATAQLKYGVSVTDACIDWATTEVVLRDLAKASKKRKDETTSPFKFVL
jgi:3-deoxy-7-phosphoheptulonate synthase